MIPPRITQVEFHVSHSCNLTCESCSHFSQDGHSGRATVESFVGELGPWSKRLAPRFLLLLGGEPTLNPDLCGIVEASRKLWPVGGVDGTRILLVTNGWFLHKHPGLGEVLKTNDIRLDLSTHHNDPEYLAKLNSIVAWVRKEWSIEPHMGRTSYRDWTRIYKGSRENTLPYTDNNPQASWKACVSKECMQFHEGRLWKCPPVTYLPMQHKKYGLDEQAWASFLSYKALDPTCTDTELLEFVNRKCEAICGQCPAKPESFHKPLPVRPGQLSLTMVGEE